MTYHDLTVKMGESGRVRLKWPGIAAQSLNNLGLVQYELREYAAAKQSYQEALAIRRKSLPPDHPDIAQSLNVID